MAVEINHKQNYRLKLSHALIAFSLVVSQCAFASDVERSYEETVSEVVRIATKKFSEHLKEYYADEEAVPETADLLEFSKGSESYSIGISQTDEMYIVVFLRRRVPPFERVVGGGGEYHFRKSDLAIIKFIGYK